jgi:membrane-bound lytic murein transglycosylase D
MLLIIVLNLMFFAVKAQDTSNSIAKMNAEVKSKVDLINSNKYIFGKIGSKSKTINDVKSNYQTQYLGSGNFSIALNEEAQAYITRFKPKNETELRSIKSWGAYYLSTMENILVSKGIPRQLVYLAVVETHLDPNLVSWAGAAGMWQFIPETGRMYGLQVSGGVDERFDWHKSTYAAADFLKDLYIQFNDWLLVAAAYNGGPGRVKNAIRQSGSKDFWTLQKYLRFESSNYVKKFIATQYIMEGSTAIITIKPVQAKNQTQAKPFFNPLEKGAVALDTTGGMLSEKITGRYNSLIIAKYILLDIQSFNILNPNFDATLAKNDSEIELRLPKDKMKLFKENKLQIMNESLHLYLSIALSTENTKTKEDKKKN